MKRCVILAKTREIDMKIKPILLFCFIMLPIVAMEMPETQGRSLSELPAEVKAHILYYVAASSDNFDDAVKAIRNYMRLSKDFDFYVDEQVNTELINILARRFPYFSKAIIALKLHTVGAGKWLQKHVVQSQPGRNSIISAFSYAVIWGTDDEINFLLKNVPSLINEFEPSNKIAHLHGLTPLMAAVNEIRLKSVQKLLAVPGIEINKKDANGHTALWHAQNPSNPVLKGKSTMLKVIELLKAHRATE